MESEKCRMRLCVSSKSSIIAAMKSAGRRGNTRPMWSRIRRKTEGKPKTSTNEAQTNADASAGHMASSYAALAGEALLSWLGEAWGGDVS